MTVLSRTLFQVVIMPIRHIAGHNPRTRSVSSSLPVTGGDEERATLTGPTVPYEQSYLSPRIPWRHGR